MCRCAFDSVRPRPVPRTSAWSGPRCSTGPTRGTRRDFRVPYRGHRRPAGLRGELRRDSGRPALARPELGRRPRSRWAARAVPPVAAHRDLPRGGREAPRIRRGLPGVLHAGGGRGPPHRRRANPKAGLRQLRPRADRRAACRVRSRGPQTGAAAADAGRRPQLARSGPRHNDIRRGHGAGLRADAGHRRAAVHLGQSGRRRADEDHSRAARRGPAALDTAPDRPVPGADAHRCGGPGAGIRPSANGSGEGTRSCQA